MEKLPSHASEETQFEPEKKQPTTREGSEKAKQKRDGTWESFEVLGQVAMEYGALAPFPFSRPGVLPHRYLRSVYSLP